MDGEGEGVWERERVMVSWVDLVRVGWWVVGLEGALSGLMVVDSRRCREVGGVAVRGGRRVGWILRFRSAVRRGVGFLLNILRGCLGSLLWELALRLLSMFEQIVSWIRYG